MDSRSKKIKLLNLWHVIIVVALFLPITQTHVSSSSCNKSHGISSELKSDELNLTPESIDARLIFDYHEHNLNFSSDEITIECRRSLELVSQHAKMFDMSAIKLLDSSAKITSGILSGNINNFGHFDECIQARINDFQGKYCLTETQFEVRKQLIDYKQLILSNEPYKNDIDDITHILPRTSSILWGICVPSHCSHNDVEIALRNTVRQKFGKYLTSFNVQLRERNCQTHEEFSWGALSVGTKAALLTTLLLLLLTCVATAYDALSLPTAKNQVLVAFSMTRNFKEIISTKLGSSEIPSLNGIRCLCTLLIIIGHKSMMTCMVPIVNKVSVGKLYASFISIPHRSMFLYTEIFLMLSGLLLAHSLVGKLNRGSKISMAKEVAARYFRFMPPVIALMLFSTFLLPLIGSGPLWPDLVYSQSDICKENGWRNLLMIHNWFGFENICNFNLHHVGTDFLLFMVLVPIVIYGHSYPRLRTSIIVGLCSLSVIARFYVSYVTDMSIYIRYGSDVKQMMSTANDMYGIPPYRLTSYTIGVLLGYTLRSQKPQKLGTKTVNCGWILAAACFLITFTMATVVHVTYTPLNMALFSAISPILFCLNFVWIIYVSYHQSGNRVTRFFEWKYFKITSTLSYAVYLIQFQVFNYKAGVTRGTLEYSIYSQMFDINELIVILLAAFVMTLLVEIPFGNLKKIIFDKKPQLEQTDAKHSEMKSK